MIALAPSQPRLFDVVDTLVDERVGIIRKVYELPRQAGEPDFFHFRAQACDTRAFGGQMNFSLGGAAGADRPRAMAKAIGEAVERYCSAIYNREDCLLASFRDADFPCVPPNDFALYDEAQYASAGFKYRPFSPDAPVRWTPMQEWSTGHIWHAPAAMVWLPYAYDTNRGETPIVQPISTGLACHCSFEEAAIGSICEVVERDAFTITWQAGLSRPQIRTQTLSERNQNLVSRLQRAGGTVTLLDLTTDHGIPTVLAVVRRKAAEAPALVFAASASLDPEDAVRKSIEELAHTWRLAQQLHTHAPPLVPGPRFENVISQDDHVHLYCDHANATLADFVFRSDERVEFGRLENLATGDPKNDLACLAERIRAVGHRVLLADLTTPDAAELGLAVVRAVIPGFHPLVIGHRLRALGGSRLWEVPQKLGYAGIRRDSGDNPAPHPYP